VTWDVGPAERRAFLAGVCAADDIIIRDAATDRDDMADVLAKFLAAELAGQPDALPALPERLLPHGNGKSARKGDWPGGHDHDGMHDVMETLLASRPDYLLPERGQPADRWLRTVLYNRKRDRIRAEDRHRRIEREHATELAGRYKGGTTESAERVYLRLVDEQDIRRRILKLPPKLATVAMLMYEGYSAAETGRLLDIPAATVRKRAQSVRSPKIRRALCL
jgi:DNA-directed RNA polymerase specialized sigma24 family protein